MLVTIDNEQMKVESVAGNVLTIAADGRGWAGTTAASHSSGASVRGQVGAYYHNRLSAEIQAITTTMGPAFSNIAYYSHLHNFTPQTPGGSLSVGSNTITLTPVPLGVNAAGGSHHKLYISGGTGTAEAVPITGGTAVSGAATGTVIVTCANTHSGAWTVSSATAGIQEAVEHVRAGGIGGTVLIRRGTHTIYATITIRGSSIVVKGEGRNTSTIASTYHGGPLVHFDGPNSPGGLGDCNEFCDITLRGDGSPGSNYALHVDNQTFSHFNRISTVYVPGGIKVTGNTNSFATRFHQINMVGITGDGIHIDALPNGGQWDDIFIGGDNTSGSNGIHLVRCEGFRLSNAYTIYCGNGFLADPTTANVYWLEIVNAYFDTSAANGFVLNPGGIGQVVGAKLTHVTAASTAGAVPPAVGVGCGFLFGAGTIAGVNMVAVLAIANSGIGFYLVDGDGYEMTACYAMQNSTGGNDNSYDGVVILNASDVKINGGSFAAIWGQPDTQRYGIAVSALAADVRIDGAVVTPNVSGSIANGSSTTVITNCRGYNPVGLAAVTVTASPFTYTAGSSPETVYVQGGTVTQIARPGGFVIANTTIPSGQSIPVALAPHDTVTITYSVAPTMFKDVQ
jgi:hypothetical protein